MRITVVCACASLVAIASLGCSSSDSTVSAPPTKGAYTITFPSTAAAVAADSVEVTVYEATSADVCQDLVQKRVSHQDLPTPLAPSTEVSTCDLAAKDTLAVSFGDRAVLVIARGGQKELFIGCTAQSVDATSATITIPLTNIDESVVVPPTSCARLSAHCAKQC